MADVKISALPAASTPLTGGEVLPIVQSSTTKQVAVSNLTAGLAGTASININGTVGATTPTTGAFTSGTFSTSITVGTAASSTGVFAAVQGTSATVSGTNTFWQDTAPIFGIFNLSNTANTVAGLRFGLGSANNAVAAIAGVQESTTLGALAFYTGGQGRASTVPERMRIDSAGAVTIPGTLGVTGTITPGQTTGIVGTTTNNNVQAGSVGEFISASVASGSAVTLTSDAAANVTTISLTAGDWDVSGVVLYLQPGTTSINNAFSGPSQTSATLGAVGSYSTIYNQGVSAADPAITSPVVRMSLSGTTTIYLVARSNFSVSTLKAYGFISARRVR